MKIVILVAFLVQLSKCRFRDISESRQEPLQNINDTLVYPNLMVQQKEKEGVSNQMLLTIFQML